MPTRSWLPDLGGKTNTITNGSVERKDAATRRAASASGLVRFGGKFNPYMRNWELDRAIRDGYERVLWVYRAIDAIASNESRLPIIKLAGQEPDAPLAKDNDPILRLLNRRANPYERAAAFRYRLVSQLMLSKRGVFVEVVYNNGGSPSAFHLLPPTRTTPIPDDDKFVSGFAVTFSMGNPDIIPATRPDGKPNVIWLRKPHPTDPYMGVTPMESAGLSIDMDYFARLYNRAFLQNDGRPGGILGVKGELDDEDAMELKRRFSGGPSQAGRTSVIEADNLEWLDTAISPRDAQFAQILKLTKEDVLTAFGTPLSVLGDSSNRTFDNADQEKENFWQETMESINDMLDGEFDAVTLGGFEDDARLAHDTSGVEALQRMKTKRDSVALEQLKEGGITIDEFREITGRDPFDVKETRAIFVPTARSAKIILTAEDQAAEDAEAEKRKQEADQQQIGQGGEGETPAIAAAPEQPALPAASAESTAEATTTAGTTEGAAKGADALYDFLTGLSGESKRRVALVLGADDDPLILGALGHGPAAADTKDVERFLERQERIVTEKLFGAKCRKDTALWEPAGTTPLPVKTAFDMDRWDSEARADFDGEKLDVVKQLSRAALDSIEKRVRAVEALRTMDPAEKVRHAQAQVRSVYEKLPITG